MAYLRPPAANARPATATTLTITPLLAAMELLSLHPPAPANRAPFASPRRHRGSGGIKHQEAAEPHLPAGATTTHASRRPAVGVRRVGREAASRGSAVVPVQDGGIRLAGPVVPIPIAPVCDLDPRAPHGKTVLGLSVVAWYDRGAGDCEWRVFEDACPHRLAPLSQGRIDGKGRLQCAHQGWCFDGAGACAFVPQAPALGPPVHRSSRACVASYPCVVQNDILWFYQRTEAEHRDVLRRKRPPYFAEIGDPSYFTTLGIRDVSVGYDVAVDNIFNIAYVPYAHKRLLPNFRDEEDPGRYVPDLIDVNIDLEHDQECGDPIKMEIEHADVHGFLSNMKGGSIRFVAPCTFHGTPATKVAADGEAAFWFMLVALIIPVAPGRSRVIWAFPRNAGVWLHKLLPRWFFHSVTNRVIDSDLCLMHVEEHKFSAVGVENWHRSCNVPTSSDGMVVAFRDWFRKHCNHQVGWAASQPDHQLPPSSTKDRLLERYWSHVVQCTSCSAALSAMRAIEVALQVASVAAVGFLAVAKGSWLSRRLFREPWL